DELRREWFDQRSVAGVTAGASTPDDVIDEVVARIESY
nr:4-hydroxy-3-methylbut-2-enyl diphosphate reductase [Chloroflexia bacterium]